MHCSERRLSFESGVREERLAAEGEVHHALRAFVEYEDGRGNKEKIYSLPTDVIENVNDNPEG